MDIIILTSKNITASLNSKQPAYYVIKDDLALYDDLKLPKGSVVDFRGGALKSSIEKVSRKVDLNGSTVRAAAYCIFSNGISVTGFGNSYVKSEWFKDSGLTEEAAINRSLRAAQEVPVHLEGRIYELSGPIIIQRDNQALVSPGILLIHNDHTAIEVDKDHITLDINRIQFLVDETTDKYTPPRSGTGILLTGNARYIDIKVNLITGLGRGISVIPGDALDSDASFAIQYCTIRFKHITNTNYCFYVDIFANAGGRSGSSLGTRFSDTRVIGGRMQGGSGIYFVNPAENNPGSTIADSSESVTRLLFENIGFEHLTDKPMYLNHVSSSKFLYLRFAESLPGMMDGEWCQNKKWYILNHVSCLTISLKGLMDPMRIDVGDDVRNVIFDAFIIDHFGWYINHLDRVAIMPLYDKETGAYKPTMVATSSTQPYNMAKTIIADKNSIIGPVSNPLTVTDLLPYNDMGYVDIPLARIKGFNVLPRTLNVIIKEDSQLVIDLTGLSRFAPCLIDVYAMIERGGSLVFSISDHKTYKKIKIIENGDMRTVDSVTFNEWGLYRLTFDNEWNTVITKVTL